MINMTKRFLFLAIITLSLVQCSPPKSPEVSGNEITFSTDYGALRLQWCTPSMFRVSLADSAGVYSGDSDSLMVITHQWDDVDAEISRKDGSWIITTSEIKVNIDVADYAITVYNSEGRLISQSNQNLPQPMGYHDGEPFFSNRLFADEHFFGFGERMDFISQRGKLVSLNVGRGIGLPHEVGAYNILNANYSPVPFFMSNRGYGIFFHNANPSLWDMGFNSKETYHISASGGAMDYYFIYGPTFFELLKDYTSVTGTTPLLPRTAMGLHVGTYSGGTWGHEHLTHQNNAVKVAKRFREEDVPADILHLDSTWRIFGKVNGKGGTTFEWRQPGFPNPKAMFDAIYDLNYSMVGLHIRPRIDNGESNNLLDQAQKLGLTYPEDNYAGDFPNFFDSTAVNWWWENGLKPLADLGAMFVKSDEGSAFGHHSTELVDKTGPQGDEIAELHNLFPIVYAKAPFEKFQEYNAVRGMNHTREGFAGIQRYPFIFAGDWPSEWQYFKPVVRAGINIGMSGIGAWSHCMGGFEHVADPELYIRWTQFGMFSPIAMLFGMEHPNYKEPWNYGKEALDIFRKYDKLRYRLVPYIYSSFYQMYQTGAPIMRGLVMHYPEDENTYSIDDQYMFGDNMMVCPVLTKGAVTRTIYFPKGDWFDYWTGEKIEGHQYKLVVTPIEKLPIYVKSGSIIPMQPEMSYLTEKKVDPLTLHLFLGEGSFLLYEDDGKSLEYQKGIFAETEIKQSWTEDQLIISIDQPKGKFSLENSHLVLKVEPSQKPQEVKMMGKGEEIKFLEVPFSQWNNSSIENRWAYDAESKVVMIMGRRDVKSQTSYLVSF